MAFRVAERIVNRKRHKVGLAINCLHISAVLYLLIGTSFLLLTMSDDLRIAMEFGVVLFIFCLAMVVGIEYVVYGLTRRKYWAWIVALCIFGIYVMSAFFPLGALGLWGLLDKLHFP